MDRYTTCSPIDLSALRAFRSSWGGHLPVADTTGIGSANPSGFKQSRVSLNKKQLEAKNNSEQKRWLSGPEGRHTLCRGRRPRSHGPTSIASGPKGRHNMDRYSTCSPIDLSALRAFRSSWGRHLPVVYTTGIGSVNPSGLEQPRISPSQKQLQPKNSSDQKRWLSGLEGQHTLCRGRRPRSHGPTSIASGPKGQHNMDWQYSLSNTR
jgi:hypothetical protein